MLYIPTVILFTVYIHNNYVCNLYHLYPLNSITGLNGFTCAPSTTKCHFHFENDRVHLSTTDPAVKSSCSSCMTAWARFKFHSTIWDPLSRYRHTHESPRGTDVAWFALCRSYTRLHAFYRYAALERKLTKNGGFIFIIFFIFKKIYFRQYYFRKTLFSKRFSAENIYKYITRPIYIKYIRVQFACDRGQKLQVLIYFDVPSL